MKILEKIVSGINVATDTLKIGFFLTLWMMIGVAIYNEIKDIF